MNDTRVKSFRDAIERLAESLDATIRVERWQDSDAVPESLTRAAAELPARLEAASRLAAGKFVASTADAANVDAMRTATDRLAAAYGAYQQNSATDSPRAASMVLENEMGQVRSDTGAW